MILNAVSIYSKNLPKKINIKFREKLIQTLVLFICSQSYILLNENIRKFERLEGYNIESKCGRNIAPSLNLLPLLFKDLTWIKDLNLWIGCRNKPKYISQFRSVRQFFTTNIYLINFRFKSKDESNVEYNPINVQRKKIYTRSDKMRHSHKLTQTKFIDAYK